MVHIPVLLNEVLVESKGLNSPPKRIFDGTFGRGGHSQALLSLFPEAELVAFDRDQAAIEFGKVKFKDEISSGRVRLFHQNYSQIDTTQFEKFDFMLLDLGVSSPQLDEGERGFSFYHEGPLDMRMDQTQDRNASDLLHELSEKELVQVFQNLGEIPRPHRVVRAIVHDRQDIRFETTQQLAGLIERVDGWRVKGIHPATRYFMALRMAVNEELEGVKEALPKLRGLLNPDGRLVVITFHSLEDRIVKYDFKENPDSGFPVHKKVIQATDEEIKMNPRARSAKLRAFQKQGSYEGQKRGSST